MGTFWRIWSPSRGYWYLEHERYGEVLHDDWTPHAWDARPETSREWADKMLKQLRTGHHGERVKYPPCPDAKLLRVTVRRRAVTEVTR